MELQLQNLTKYFGTKPAVNQVSLTITPGVWGLIGANGAGKTTLMRMLTGTLTPTSGKIFYDGIDIFSLGEGYRDVLGYLPQKFGFYPEFTVIDYLEYIATLKGLKKGIYRERIHELLEILTLTDVYKKSIRKLSGGMQRRRGIAQALLNNPEVLILDEPTSGLDPGERVRFRNLLSEFAKERIVLISTHIVSDIEYIAFQNIIMKDGQLIDSGTTEELLKNVADKVFTATICETELENYEKRTRIISVKNEEGRKLSVRYIDDVPVIPDSEKVQACLEDLYLWLFRKELRSKEEDILC